MLINKIPSWKALKHTANVASGAQLSFQRPFKAIRNTAEKTTDQSRHSKIAV